jgi:hypothetical protein
MKEARLGLPTWNVHKEACAVNGLDCTHYEQTGFLVQMHHDHPNVPQT